MIQVDKDIVTMESQQKVVHELSNAIQMQLFAMILKDPYSDVKVTPLFDAEYPRNG